MDCVAGNVYNIEKWIEENKKLFLPPVCNKMMYNQGQMKCFFVGGPNQRKDFHLECGEELFYQRKGDMVLKIVERGKHRDVVIKEGEMFLLPCRLPHSPQRLENTVGLVMERERAPHEKDGLRYFVEKDGRLTNETLYEEWFYCDNLGALGPIIKRFFESEQSKTGQPIPGTILKNPPLIVDEETIATDPFDFHKWIETHREEINEKGFKRVFPEENQFQVFVYGAGENGDCSQHAETWMWQLEGQSEVSYDDSNTKMVADDSLLIPVGKKFTVHQEPGSLLFLCYQDPTKSTTWAM